MIRLLLFLLAPLVLVAGACHASAGDPILCYNPTQGYYYTYPAATAAPTVEREIVRELRVRLIEVAQINPAYTSSYNSATFDSTTQAEILNELRRLGLRVDQNSVDARAAVVAATSAATAAATAAQIAAALAVVKNPPVPIVVPPIVHPVPVPPMPKAEEEPKKEALVPEQRPGSGLAAMNSTCVKCHQTGHLKEGQTFALLSAKGSLNALTDSQKLEVIHRVLSGKSCSMPPPDNKLGIALLTLAQKLAIVADINNR